LPEGRGFAVRQAGRQSTVSTLSEGLGIDQPRASKLVARAIERGLVERGADQRDGRRSPLVLTASGRAQLHSVHRFRRAAFAQAMTTWTVAERTQFAVLLNRFVDALNDGVSR